jgi:hypothetical protein
MRWETVSSASGNEVYQLFIDDKKVLTLSFNPFSNSARIEFNKEKRVFMIRKEGFRKKKTVLLSEYGIKIGELGHENKQDFIHVNDDRFYYTIQNNPLTELILFKESKDKPIVTCSLNTFNGKTSIELDKAKNIESFSHTALLMALCWYLFLPAAKENIPELVL